MSVLDRTAHRRGQSGEAANIELARQLAEEGNRTGIDEVAEALFDEEKALRHDCIKVLYEVGKIRPELIEKHVGIFLELLDSKSNRMVWGAMIALSTVADIEAESIHAKIESIYRTMAEGSVITIDAGIRVLAGVASIKPEYNQEILPYLLEHLRTCRSKEIPQHTESIIPAVGTENMEELLAILTERKEELTKPQEIRVERIIKRLRKDGQDGL